MELDLRQLSRLVRRWWWLLLLASVIAAGTAYWSSSRQAPLYSATATLLINPSQTQGQQELTGLQAGERLGATYQRLVATDPILRAVIDRLALPVTVDELRERVTASAVTGTQLLRISVSDTDPVRAAEIANAVATEFPTLIAQQTAELSGTAREALDRQIADTEQRIDDLEQEIQAIEQGDADNLANAQGELASLRASLNQFRSSYSDLLLRRQEMEINEAATQNRVTVWEAARIPEDPYAPRTALYTLLALAAGFLIAAGAVILLEYLDNTVKSDTDLAGLVGAPLLAAISRVANVRSGLNQRFVQGQPKSGAAEAVRLLRTNLEFAAAAQEIATLGVTSPGPGEGKSTVTANLAIAMAQGGYSVVVVDADLRRPTQHRIFDVRNDRGLTTLLIHPDMAWHAAATKTETDGLLLIPSGPIPPNPADLLGLGRFGQLLEELGQAVDIVLIDTSPVLAVSDPLVVGTSVDAMAVVCLAGRTRRDTLQRAVELLRQGGIRLVGVVLNGQQARAGEGYYYGYYGQESGDERDQGWVAPLPEAAVPRRRLGT